MRRFTPLLCGLAFCAMLQAPLLASTPLPRPVQEHPATTALLQRKMVRLQSSGQADLAFRIAVEIIHDDDFLFALQQAYAMLLPEGEQPEFTVKQTAPGQYAYVNRDGEQTQITEVHRVASPECVELYIFSEGDRFFGRFEALTAISVTPLETDQVDWQVKVYAYPHNLFSRLIARTGAVNRFFRSKTDEITDLAVQIGVFMTKQQKQDIDGTPPLQQEKNI